MTELAAPIQSAVDRDQAFPLFRWLIDKYGRRRDAAALARLDDHILKDIGMTRYDLEVLAKS